MENFLRKSFMRRQTGDGRLTTGVKIILAVLTINLAACATDPAVNNEDSATITPDSTAIKSMTITEPVSPVPKIEADSIWNGDYVKKYDNGVVERRGYITGGLASGEWLTFYDDGRPWSKGYYHNGVRTGYGVSWYHDGQKSSEGYYNNGKQVGMWSYWSESSHQLSVKDWGGVMPDTTSRK
jgi:hypothetical protein